MDGEPKFFATPAAWRRWLARNHDRCDELWVGYYKVDSGKKSVTWPESVDEALCYGWIDGLRRSIDEVSYKIRFTPRKKTSRWSKINLERVAVLDEEGRMQPAGLAAFAARKTDTGPYSYERRKEAVLPEAFAKRLARNRKARAFFEAQPAWYRQAAIHWVVSAKREETRERRFATLLDDSAAGRTIKPLTRPTGGRGRR